MYKLKISYVFNSEINKLNIFNILNKYILKLILSLNYKNILYIYFKFHEYI